MELHQQVIGEWDAPSVSIFLVGLVILGYQLEAKRRLGRIEEDAARNRRGSPHEEPKSQGQDAGEQPMP